MLKVEVWRYASVRGCLFWFFFMFFMPFMVNVFLNPKSKILFLVPVRPGWCARSTMTTRDLPMTITDVVYDRYLDALLAGDGARCSREVTGLLEADVAIATLYTDLFQRSLYRVGELWETNRISVAVEHLATAITERLLAGVYPRLLSIRQPARHKAVVSCGVNEYHQVGARMVADVMELNGWDAWFLGASTPVNDLLGLIDDKKPDLVGLSLSMYFNIGPLKDLIQTLKAHYRQLDIFIGGQAFRWGGSDIAGQFANVTYVPSLDDLARTLRAER